MRAATGAEPAGLAGRGVEEAILSAQLDLAEDLARAICEGRLTTSRYQHWLACESVLCRLHARALERLSEWHGAQPTLRAAAQQWSMAMCGDALAAAAGSQRHVLAPMPQLIAWQTFLESTTWSSRAGEAVGAVVLHARLMHGPMHETVKAIALLPQARGDRGQYLLQRCRAEPGAQQQGRSALLDAYSRTALGAGARRVADWYRALLGQVLEAEEPALQARGAKATG